METGVSDEASLSVYILISLGVFAVIVFGIFFVENKMVGKKKSKRVFARVLTYAVAFIVLVAWISMFISADPF